jgi:hypothetical protein
LQHNLFALGVHFVCQYGTMRCLTLCFLSSRIVVTDSDRKFVLAVATASDLEVSVVKVWFNSAI